MLFHEHSENQVKEITEWQDFIVFHQSSCCWINNDIQEFFFTFYTENMN